MNESNRNYASKISLGTILVQEKNNYINLRVKTVSK